MKIIKNCLNYMKKHKIFTTIIVIVLIVVLVVQNLLSSASKQLESLMNQTAMTEVVKMDLEEIVTGTGTLKSATSMEVTTTLSTNVSSIKVVLGEEVTKDQILAIMDTTEIDDNIAKTRNSIEEAKKSDALSLSQTERKLTDAKDDRQRNYDKLHPSVVTTEEELKKLNSDYNAAAISEINKSAEKNILDTKQASLENEKANLDARVSELNDASNALVGKTAADSDYAALSDNLTFAQDAKNLAQTAVDTAQAEYDLAKVNYENYYNSNYDIFYAAAKASYETALKAYNTAYEAQEDQWRRDSSTIQSYQDSIDTMNLKSSASTYETQLETYLKEKEKATIKAPISGTVTSVNAKVGQKSTTSLFTIEDMTNLEVSISVPDYDAVNLEKGMTVRVEVDAFSKEIWTGTIKEISAKVTDTSGNFTVTVSITSDIKDLAIGMNSTANIIVNSKKNVFAVPYDAVITNASGKTVIVTMDGELRKEIEVTTGMETDYYIEIASPELVDGMQILADPDSRNVQSNNGIITFGMGRPE